MNKRHVMDAAQKIPSLLDDLIEAEAMFTTRSTVVVRGKPRIPISDLRDIAQARLDAAGIGATIESTDRIDGVCDAVLVTVRLAPEKSRSMPFLNIILFLATISTTILFGGFDFAIWFMAILLFHEFGHFLVARRRGIDVSWPFFIPAPNLLGTFGAFIQLRSPIQNRRDLFDMAVAGPLAGFVVAVAALVVGISQSTIIDTEGLEDGLFLGESLLFQWIVSLTLPGVTDQQDILLHPVAFAGWAGLLVTMFNLLPMGQLDGGHIAYAMFRKRQRVIAVITIILLGIAAFWWPWWLVWAGIGLVLRPKHPPTVVDEIPIGRGRQILGILALIIFILSFTPVPFHFG